MNGFLEGGVVFAFGLTLLAGLSTGLGSLAAFLTRRTNKAFLCAALGFSAIFGVVAIKLALATVLNPADGRRAAALSRPPAPAAEAPVARATVTDRNGEILAVSLPLTALYANPRQIENPAAAACTIASPVGSPPIE